MRAILGAGNGALITGSRKCIGDRFAETESLIVLAWLRRDFSVEIEPGHTPVSVPSVTLRPGGGVQARRVPSP